jgi:transposase-like protein
MKKITDEPCGCRFSWRIEEYLGVHFRRTESGRAKAASKERVHTMPDSILDALSLAVAREALERVSTESEEKAPVVPAVLGDGFEDRAAALALPEKYRLRLRIANAACCFLEEICRPEKVVRIFPHM